MELPPEITELAEKLTPAQLSFAMAVLQGKSQSAAYRESHPDCTPESARVGGHRMITNVNVSAFIKTMQERKWKSGLMEYNQKRAWLAEVVGLNVCEVLDEEGNVRDEYSHLIREVSQQYDKKGSLVRNTIKFFNKLEAIKLDNQMAGHDAPSQNDDDSRKLDVDRLLREPDVRESLISELERTAPDVE